jgi:2-iminobutanoate/2-iminopropanoate deaminase
MYKQMNKEPILTSAAPVPGGAYSQAVRFGGLLFTAGEVGIDPVTGVLGPTLREQTEQAIRNVDAIIQAAGGSLASVVKTTCFLRNMEDFPTFNEVYSRMFPDPRPARSTIGVDLAEEFLVEIEAVAVLGEGA